MLEKINKIVEKFNKISEKDTEIRIISHLDTDGICSAAILAKALQRQDKRFWITIVKQLEEDFVKEIIKKTKTKQQIIVFLDLGSGLLHLIKEIPTEVFILDHHEIGRETLLPDNINLINCHLHDTEEVCGSAITYLLAKALDNNNKNLAHLAILGMVGDMMAQNMGRISNSILKDAENVTMKKGLLLFSSTRLLHKALEFSSIFIPGVTGSSIGAINLLREAEIKLKNEKGYRNLTSLTKDEVSRLVTTIMLRRLQNKEIPETILGNIYLIKFLNRLEDARELSTLINACSRLGYSGIALALCLGCEEVRTKAEGIYNDYKYQIIKGLNYINNSKKIEGKRYIIINAKHNIKDTIIGTIMSIISKSFLYQEGNAIIGMAYRKDKKIKVSARMCGRGEGINLRELIDSTCKVIGHANAGGHAKAAGCLIPLDKEKEFIDVLRKKLDLQEISIKIKE